MIFSLMILFTIGSDSSSDISYGEVYLEETGAYQAPLVSTSLGYAFDLNNTFLNLNSVVGSAQFRLWRYLTTGVMGQWIKSSYTKSGDSLRRLSDTADLVFDLKLPRWGMFSLSQLHLMIGKWNIMNLTSLEISLIMGAGAGFINYQKRLNSNESYEISYLWSAEQRIRFNQNFGFSVSFFGHREAVFFQPSLFASF
ncbi:MAG: hypothetical protein COV44_01160 [Deltaproteobacteria bacterium CG11_big_fil_rev_8_21_14_0_20_45_16]|nr:MAG: hypothetical protein COV44_01160 [Deltaproteobacteria bacterium CG11_big_fil_rev_8_21_14_0_20_45_16]